MNEGVLTWAILCLGLVVLVLGYFLFCALKTIFWLREELQVVADTEHAKCIGAITKYVGDEWAAQVLEVAADDYDSAEGLGQLRELRNHVWEEDGPTVPALWMRRRASVIRILGEVS